MSLCHDIFRIVKLYYDNDYSMSFSVYIILLFFASEAENFHVYYNIFFRILKLQHANYAIAFCFCNVVVCLASLNSEIDRFLLIKP